VRTLVLSLVVMLTLQGGAPRADSARPLAGALDRLRARLARTCVPTASMPIAGLRGRPPEPMPVARPDSVRDSAMVIRVVPCYLVDSLVAPRGVRDSEGNRRRC
jgi:hypothetical protein